MTARRGERGFTIIELLTYLALASLFLAGLAGTEVMAGKLRAREASYVQALTQVDALFSQMQDDCGRARGARIEGGKAVLEGAGTYDFDVGGRRVARDGKLVLGDLADAKVSLDGSVLSVEVRVVRGDPADPSFDKKFARKFHVPGGKGVSREW